MPGMADIDYQSSDDRKHGRGPVLRELFGGKDAIWSLLARPNTRVLPNRRQSGGRGKRRRR